MKRSPVLILIAVVGCAAAIFRTLGVAEERRQTSPTVPSFDVPERYAFIYDEFRLPDGQAEKARQLPFTSIELVCPPYAGFDPQFEVKISAPGDVEYNGLQYAPFKGRRRGVVSPEDYGRLCYAIESSEFLELKSRYDPEKFGFHGRAKTIRLAGKDGIVQEFVSHNEAAPVPFWMTEHIIVGLLQRVSWR